MVPAPGDAVDRDSLKSPVVRSTTPHCTRVSRWMRVPADDQVFIVRCWNERRDVPDGPAQWRVRVSHLNTDNEAYFNDPAEILLFLAKRLAEAEKAAPDEASK